MRRLALPFLLLPLCLTGCSQGYSPNTYAATAAQQQAAVARGVIIGVRPVLISANGTIGAATGGAAGGIAGAQVPGSPVVTAFGAIGGALVGGVAGSAAQQAMADAKGWEYIVQEDGDKLISVTQTSKAALPLGLHVLVIAGTQQARIVPDYTVQTAAPPAADAAVASAAKNSAAPDGAAATEIDVGPIPPAAGAVEPLQIVPLNVVSGPAAPPAPGPAPSSTSGKAATPAAVNNGSPAAGTPAAGATATSAQAAPGAMPPVSSSAAATP